MQEWLLGLGFGLAAILAARYINRALDSLEPRAARQAATTSRSAWAFVRQRSGRFWVAVGSASIWVGVGGYFLAEGEYGAFGGYATGIVSAFVYSFIYGFLGRHRYLVMAASMFAWGLGWGLYWQLQGTLDSLFHIVILAISLTAAAVTSWLWAFEYHGSKS